MLNIVTTNAGKNIRLYNGNIAGFYGSNKLNYYCNSLGEHTGIADPIEQFIPEYLGPVGGLQRACDRLYVNFFKGETNTELREYVAVFCGNPGIFLTLLVDYGWVKDEMKCSPSQAHQFSVEVCKAMVETGSLPGGKQLPSNLLVFCMDGTDPDGNEIGFFIPESAIGEDTVQQILDAVGNGKLYDAIKAKCEKAAEEEAGLDFQSRLDKLLNAAYNRYIADWCNDRSDNLLTVIANEEASDGCMFVCKDEFEQYEFRDKEYMQAILLPYEWQLYKKLVLKEKEDCPAPSPSVYVDTPAGRLVAKARTDADYPGLSISLEDKNGASEVVAVVEHVSGGECASSDTPSQRVTQVTDAFGARNVLTPGLMARVYNDGDQDEPVSLAYINL